VLRRLLLIAAATVTIAVTTHAGLGWLLLWTVTICATNIKPNSKVQATEARVGNLVTKLGTVSKAQATATSAVNTRVNNLSGQATGSGLPSGTPTGGPNGSDYTSTSSSYPTGQTSSAGSPAHVHDYGGHWHDMQNHTHDFDGHTHDLPTV
jgi:hypothetical protein